MSKTVDDETTYFVNDLNQRYEQVVQTYNEDGIVDTFTYGLQRIDSKGQTTETYLYDGRGSVTGSVGTDHSFASYSYTAYGELMPNSPQPEVFGYNAESTDFETGIQYLRARYYDTGLQRFVNEDAWRGNYRAPKSLNRYGYTFNNPVMYADNGGNKPVEVGSISRNSAYYEQTPKTTTKVDATYEAKMRQIYELEDFNDYQGSVGLGNGSSYTINPNDSVEMPSNDDYDKMCYERYRNTAIASDWSEQQRHQWAENSYDDAKDNLAVLVLQLPNAIAAESMAQSAYTKAKWKVVGAITWAILTNLAVVAALIGIVAALAAVETITLGLATSIIVGGVIAIGDFDWLMAIVSLKDVKESIADAQTLKKERDHYREEVNELEAEIEAQQTHVDELKQLKDDILNGIK